MTKKNGISDEDSALFREAIGDITPIKKKRIIPEKKKPLPRPLQRERYAIPARDYDATLR